MPQKLTLDEVDIRFAAVSAERVEPYIDACTSILIRCQNGHIIKRKPQHVWRGVGCSVCNGTYSPTQEEAEHRFKDNGYELLSTYKNSTTHVLVRCRYGHEWRTAPVCITTLKHGCPACFCKRLADRYRLSESKVSDRLKDRGIELLEPYKGALSKILMRGSCGHEWRAKLADVWGGTGCKQCARNKPVTQNEAHKRYKAVGLEMLDSYRGAFVKTLAKCGRCNREWLSKPNDVFGGHGCGKCIPTGFQKDKPGMLYYLLVSNPFGEPVYKIGITNRTVRERFYGEQMAKITIIETWHFKNGAEAFEMEQDILKDYDADRWTGPDILGSGNDELFTLDVLGLDKGARQLELVA